MTIVNIDFNYEIEGDYFMKYLTKEWYELCQRTNLYFDMKINDRAKEFNEDFYLRMYKRKEKTFVKLQREIYDVDPRILFEQDFSTYLPIETFINGEDSSQDAVIYHLSDEAKENIQKMIEEYDARPTFDEEKCKKEFAILHKNTIAEKLLQIPSELRNKIADLRVFALGYCTKEVLKELKVISKNNDIEVNRILNEFYKMQQKEKISQSIKEDFNFHDCIVTDFTKNKDSIVMCFDTTGGFTTKKMITFVNPKIIKQDGDIIGNVWLYQEVYQIDNGYEAHMLFIDQESHDLIIFCQDIIIE